MPNPEASERAILGTIVIDGDLALQHCSRLRTEMFSLDSHRRIYGVATEMLAAGSTLDYLTLIHELDRRKWLDGIGGVGYITDLGNLLPRRFDPSGHVEIVIDSWKRRQVAGICQTFSCRADGTEDTNALLCEMQSRVLDVLAETEKRDEPLVAAYSMLEFDNLVQQAKRHPSALMGMSYGVTDLDTMTNGMREGQNTVIGSRSGVGKSSLMLQAVNANCSLGIPVHLFSLEMTREQCLRRLWAIESRVPFRVVNNPSQASPDELERISTAAARIAEWPLRIHDKAELNLGQIVSRVRLSIRQHGTKLFCVDYAQNVEADGRDERTRVSNVSRTLTKLAKDEGAHVMLLSQLRKALPEMYSRPPHVSDLRETGQLENDAHVVLLLHRPWDEETAKVATDGEIIMPKQREGETGAIEVKFNKDWLIFENRRAVTAMKMVPPR